MDFGTALKMMRKGHRLTRSYWDDPKMLVWATTADDIERLKITTFYTPIDFQPTIQDIMAWDWELEDTRNR